MDHNQVLQFIDLRESQCRVERQSLEMWLGYLTPLRWFTVAGGIVLSAVGGATVLGQPALFGDSWSIVGGVCPLVASILTSLHTGLKCDAHQAECHRLIQVYSSLEAAYQAARLLPPTELSARHATLEERFEEAKTKATASAPASYRQRAERVQPVM